jgi:hypothetical protein
MRRVVALAAFTAAAASNVCLPFPQACVLDIPPATTLSIGECILPGATCEGDTTISLFNKVGVLLITNDDGYNSAACGVCSYLEYTNSDQSNSLLATLNQSCFAGTQCNGTTVYAFRPSGGAPPPPAVGGGAAGSSGPAPGAVTQTVTITSQTPTVLLICATLVTVLVVVAVFAATALSDRPRRGGTGAGAGAGPATLDQIQLHVGKK